MEKVLKFQIPHTCLASTCHSCPLCCLKNLVQFDIIDMIIIYKCSAWTCPFFPLCCPTPLQPCPTPTLPSCQSRGESQTILFTNDLREGFFEPFLTARSLNDLPSLSTSTTRKRLKDAGRSSTCDDPTVSTTRAKLSIHQVL